MSLTDVTLCGKTLCSPVIAASGTFGFGGEYAGIVDMKKLGGISGKGLTLEGKYGNEGERLWETPAGLINSIGLQNPGVRHFIEYEPFSFLFLKYSKTAKKNFSQNGKSLKSRE